MRRLVFAVALSSLALGCPKDKKSPNGGTNSPGQRGGGGSTAGSGSGGGTPGGSNGTAPIGGGQKQEIDLRVGSSQRKAYARVPASASVTGKAMPLIFMAHGGGGGNKSGDTTAITVVPNWASQFDEDYLFVFPQSDWYKGGAWTVSNDVHGEPRRDIDFLHALIDHVDANIGKVDRNRVYLAGFSAGAAFTWFVQCEAPEKFAGFAVAGDSLSSYAGKCDPNPARPVFYMHGEDDPKSLWEGQDARHYGVVDTWDWLLDSRSCGSQEETFTAGDGKSTGRRITCTECPAVEIWTMAVGHCWPKRADPSCGGFEASDLVVDFWKSAAGL